MIITTKSGVQIGVCMTNRVVLGLPIVPGDLSKGFHPDLPFTLMTGAYPGSPYAQFLDDAGNVLLTVDGIATVTDDKVSEATATPGNLLIRTLNSTYEFDQENKVFRRLAGNNPATDPNVPDGEWQGYSEIQNLRKGWNPLVFYTGEKLGKAKMLSTVREIVGTYIPPAPTEMVAS